MDNSLKVLGLKGGRNRLWA